MTQTITLGQNVPKLGLGRLPNKRFAARRDAKIASVATLALLAVSAYPGNPTKKRRQRRFLRSLRSTVFYDRIDNPLDEPQLTFIEGIKLNIDPLLCGFIGSHVGIKVFVHGDTEHRYQFGKRHLGSDADHDFQNT